jgi:hypothetical protein
MKPLGVSILLTALQLRPLPLPILLGGWRWRWQRHGTHRQRPTFHSPPRRFLVQCQVGLQAPNKLLRLDQR